MITNDEHNLMLEIEKKGISAVVEELYQESNNAAEVLQQISGLKHNIMNRHAWTLEDKAKLLVSGCLTQTEYDEALHEISSMGLNPFVFEGYKPKMFIENRSDEKGVFNR